MVFFVRIKYGEHLLVHGLFVAGGSPIYATLVDRIFLNSLRYAPYFTKASAMGVRMSLLAVP